MLKYFDIGLPMKNRLFCLNHRYLNSILEERQLQHRDLAKALGVSTKTIQRLRNQKARRFRESLIRPLADFLGVSLEDLVIPLTSIRNFPPNPLIDTITSDKYFEEIQAKENWTEYIPLLRSIPLAEISTQQEAKVLSRLAASYLFSAQNRYTKSTLEKAERAAMLANDSRTLADVYTWKSIYQMSYGDLKTALVTIRRAEEFYRKKPTPETLLTFETFASSYRGFILGHLNKLEESELCTRRSLHFLLLDKVKNRLKIARIYSRLGWIYLKKKETLKARKVFARTLEMSTRFAWPKGVALATMALGVLDMIESNTPIPPKTMSHARLYHSMTFNPALDTRYEQLRFVYKLLCEDYYAAMQALVHRRKVARHSKLLSSLVTLDKMFLARVHGRPLRLSTTERRQAQNIFSSNDMAIHLEVFTWLLKTRRISRQDFINRYIF